MIGGRGRWKGGSVALAAALLAAGASTASAGQVAGFASRMTGDQVVFNPPGDPDGAGLAWITITKKTEQVCFEVDTWNMATPMNVHISMGAAGEPAGMTVVELLANTNDPDPTGCDTRIHVPASFKNAQEMFKDIDRNPQNYHVEVHNHEHPGGAIRGQLSPAA